MGAAASSSLLTNQQWHCRLLVCGQILLMELLCLICGLACLTHTVKQFFEPTCNCIQFLLELKSWSFSALLSLPMACCTDEVPRQLLWNCWTDWHRHGVQQKNRKKTTGRIKQKNCSSVKALYFWFVITGKAHIANNGIMAAFLSFNYHLSFTLILRAYNDEWMNE